MKTATSSKMAPYFILVAAILWGLDGVLRRGLFALPPISIVFLEHLIGLIILLPFFIPMIGKEHLTRRQWASITFVSLCSGVLGTLFFTAALLKTQFIAFSVVFLMQKLQPVFATVTAVSFLGERLHRRYILWAIVALVSAYFVTFPMGIVHIQEQHENVVAALLALGSAFCWGTSTAFSKYTLQGVSFAFVAGLRFLLTVVFAFIGVLLFGALSSLATVTLPQYGSVVAIAFSTGLVALLLYYKGLQQTQAKISTLLELAFPLVAVLIDWYLYGRFLEPSQWIGAAVLLVSFYNISKLHYVDEVR